MHVDSIEDLDHVVNSWSKMNKMVISQTKKNSMLAVGKRLRKRSDRTEANINLSLNWAIIEQVKNHKLLSIHIGQDLDSDAQSVALCNRGAQRGYSSIPLNIALLNVF